MIDLVGKRKWFFLISAIVIIAGVISLAVFGLKPGVDFSSGTAMTLHFDKEVELSQLRQELTDLGYDMAVVQPKGNSNLEDDRLQATHSVQCSRSPQEAAENKSGPVPDQQRSGETR